MTARIGDHALVDDRGVTDDDGLHVFLVGVHAKLDALCAVEGRPPIGWDKGHAVLHVLREKYGPAWSERLRVIYVGDDETDEDAFRSLQGLGMTFRVGRPTGPTRARRRLSDVDAVATLLRWIASRRPGEATLR